MFQELVVAFSALVAQFESQFTAVAAQHLEDEKKKDKGAPVVAAETSGGWNIVTGQSGNYFLHIPPHQKTSQFFLLYLMLCEINVVKRRKVCLNWLNSIIHMFSFYRSMDHLSFRKTIEILVIIICQGNVS